MQELSALRKCWTRESLDRYFTTEAMSKERSAFLEVHLPIGEILIDPAYPAFSALGGKEAVGEDNLLRLVTDSRPGQANRIFLVVGETGSGKSELCQWLCYRIEDRVHVPVLIARSMIRLRDIVTEINRHLGDDVPSDMRDITDLWPETISKSLVAAMYRRLERPEVRNRIGGRDAEHLRSLMDQPVFEQRMRGNFVHYRDEIRRLDKPRELNLLPEADFVALVREAGGLHGPGPCYGELQRAIADCLASELQVEDLIEKLSHIGRRYQQRGRRPVLLIEDITTWGFLQNDLLDYLFDLSRGNYDVVIGVTTGFERANQEQIYKSQQTITERIEGRFELTDEHSETAFLRNHFVDLARLYLRAVKAQACPSCSSAAECHEVFGEYLYPFTRMFLTNVYRNLQQDGNLKQTPRLLLRALRHCLEAEESPPFESVELLHYVAQPPTYFRHSPHLSPAAQRLFKWYGINTNQGVFLPVTIAETFGLRPPEGVEQVGKHYRLPLRAGVEGMLPAPEEALSALLEELPVRVEVKPEVEAEAAPEEKKVEPERVPKETKKEAAIDTLGEMDQWLNQRGNFPRRDTFKDGVLALLDFFQLAPFELKHPHSVAKRAATLVFRRGDRRARIYLHQSADSMQPGYFKLTIEPNAGQQELFSQVLAVGLRNYDVADSNRLDHVRLYDWLNGRTAELRRKMLLSLRSALGMQAEYFVLLTKFLLLNNCEGLTTLDPVHLSKPIDGTPLQLQILGERVNHLFECRQHIDALFVAFFHLRDNLIDFPLLRRTAEAIDALQALVALEHISHQEVAKGFQISVDGDVLPLQGLVRLVTDYASSLRRIQQSGRLQPRPTLDTLENVRQLCDPPDDLTGEKLRQQVDELRHLASILKLRWQQRWNIELNALDRTPEKLDFPRFFEILITALDEGQSLDANPNVFTYIATQRLVTRIATTPEYDVLQGLKTLVQGIDKAIEGCGGPPTLTHQFREFDRAFRQYQEKSSQ